MRLYTKALLGSFLAILLALNFSCGQKKDDDRNWSLGTGFMVNDYVPKDLERNVPLDQPIMINFTSPIDPASLDDPTNFKVEALDAQSSIDSRSSVNGMLTLTEGNLTVQFVPNLANNQWQPNTTYWVTLGQGLLSIDGSRLSDAVIFRFTTGSSNVWGAQSIPGKPYLTYFEPTTTPWGDALAFMIEFNEDISYYPIAYMQLSIFGVNTGMIPLLVHPVFLNSSRHFYLLLYDYGCSDDYFIIGQKITVRIFDGEDLDSERMDPVEENFYYLKDYWGSTASCWY